MPRSFAVLAVAAALVAGARPAPRPPLLPMAPAWKTLLGEFVTAPLAAEGRRVYVATRDGAVRALDAASGEVLWRAEGVPGRVSATAGVLLVRGPDGRLTRLQPRNGAVRWATETAVAGTLAATIDEDRALVAGRGLAAVALDTGRVMWSDREAPEISAPPLRAGARVLTGHTDGSLHGRDRETGASRWRLRTTSRLLSPPLVDLARGRLYLGTTDKRILAARLRDGRAGWEWTVGADVVDPGLLLPKALLFASYDAVLYALRPGGNLAWRAPLPSRPLSGPLLVGEHVLVACLENELVAFAPETGEPAGSMRTAAEIRAAPVLAAQHVVLGLRDRSVIAYARPDVPQPPGAEPPPVEAGAGGR